MLFELILICYLSTGMSIDNLGDWELKKITGIDNGAMVEISRKVGDGHVLAVPKWCSIVKKAKVDSSWDTSVILTPNVYIGDPIDDAININEGTITYDHIIPPQ